MNNKILIQDKMLTHSIIGKPLHLTEEDYKVLYKLYSKKILDTLYPYNKLVTRWK